MTAALHLEMMRSQAQQQRTLSQSDVERNCDDEEELQPIDASISTTTESQDQIASLILESIHTLRKKIGLTIEEINNGLEELRYAAIEANEN